MINPSNLPDPDQLDRMIRDASEYVQPSFNLRPRVLEEAKAHCSERTARRFIRHLAVAVFLLGIFTATNRQHAELAAAKPFAMIGSERIVREAEAAARRGNVGWGTVEAFSESRQRQAQVLRLAL